MQVPFLLNAFILLVLLWLGILALDDLLRDLQRYSVLLPSEGIVDGVRGKPTIPQIVRGPEDPMCPRKSSMGSAPSKRGAERVAICQTHGLPIVYS